MIRLKLSLVLMCVVAPLQLISTQRTHFIDHAAKVRGLDESDWYLTNIPFVELPDTEIEQVYYYRWSSHKKHLRYTTPGAGYTVTEFVHRVFYAGKFDTINAAAGHHLYESRWLRDRRFVQDYINFWAREGGLANAYSEWIADAAWNSYLVDKDEDFIKSQLQFLIRNFDNWNTTNFDSDMGLYYISPHWDAMEQSCSSLPTDDPYHGGEGYRPSFNAEMYANAIAISNIARLRGDNDLADDFQSKAAMLRQNILIKLWDPERKFFYHMMRQDNPDQKLLDSREEIGFFPWRWNIPDNTTDHEGAWSALWDPQGFDAIYGPTTCEKRSQYYDGDQPVGQCCWWNGNSWPYSTGMMLNSLASLLRNYGPVNFLTVQDYVDAVHKYALTQYKNGVPYVAECHSPELSHWVCDNFNHSEHYAHSTYVDNVLGDLFGILPQDSDTLVIHPLVPNNWRFFAVENLRYHGHEIAIVYDTDGTYYETGVTGLQIYVNGVLVASQPTIGPMTVKIPPAEVAISNGRNKVENYAVNVGATGYPKITVSHNTFDTNPWQAVDGRIFYDKIPSNRWSNYKSGNEFDWLEIDFGPGRKKNISRVDLYIYSDTHVGGEVDCPISTAIQYWDDESISFQPIPSPTFVPEQCARNTKNSLSFEPLVTQKVRFTFQRDVINDFYVGVTEVEIWAPWPQAPPNVYEAEDGVLTNAEILASTAASGGSYVGLIDSETSSVEFTGVWVDADGLYRILLSYANGDEAVATHRVSVNAMYETAVEYSPTSGWGKFATVEIELELARGNNVIVFTHETNFAELDRLEIMS